MLSDKMCRALDWQYLETCEEDELRQLQDNLIEDYNAKLYAKSTITKSDIEAEAKRLEKEGKDLEVVYYLKRKLNELA
jgi:hypothetical protein